MEFMSALQGGYDSQKPSLFEILSEHELNGLIPPSIRYLLAVTTHRSPRYLLRILNNFDELYAVLSLAVERYYLRTYGGGFTENFYGLKRERVLRVKTGEIPRARLGAAGDVREMLKLRDSDVWKNLAIMVGIPYLRRKLDESYDIHAAGVNLLGPAYRDRDRYPSSGTWREKVLWVYKYFLRKCYPSVNAAYYFSMLAFNLAYLFDATKYYSPFLWIIGSRVRRLNAADGKAIALATAPKPPPALRPGQSTSIFSPRTFARTMTPHLQTGLQLLLPTSIFALKFLEWWHNSDFARQLGKKASEGLELPPPIIDGAPAPDSKMTAPGKRKSASFAEDKKDSSSSPAPSRRDSGASGPPISSITYLPILTVPAPAYSNGDQENTTNVCPICREEINAPTACQTGYVYCYTCIFKWVDGSHPRQEAFMEGTGEEEAAMGWVEEGGGSRVGRWDSGVGRDAVTGRRVLGGTGGLRRVMI